MRDFRQTRSSAIPYALLALIVLVVFLPLANAGFVSWDDPHNLPDNPVMNAPTWRGVAGFWTDWKRGYANLYIPLTYSIWAAVSAFAGMRPAAFHWLNIGVHVGSALVVYSILRALLNGANRWPAWLGAAIFAIHPVQVESVGWVSGMKDVLCGFLCLASIRFYIAGRQRQSALALVAATVCFVLAMLSKPSAVSLPVVAFAIDWMILRTSPRRAASVCGIWLLLALPFMAIAKQVQPVTAGTFVPPIWGRPIIALDALAFYLRQMVAPVRLGIDYGRSPSWLWNSQQITYTWTAPVALTVLIAVLWPRTRWIAAGGLILIGALLPVLGLVPFNFQSYSTVADHYLYVAMLGPALVLGWAAQALADRFAGKAEARNAVLTVAGAYVALLGLRAHIQTWTWRDSRTLFSHALSVNPQSVAANTNLGSIYINDATDLYNEGKPERAKTRLEQAERLLRSSLAVLPEDADAQYNLGRALLKLNRTADAIEAFRKSIEISPNEPDVHTELGRAYARIGQDEAAIREFEEALRIDPKFQPARQNLAEIRSRRPDLR